jgi:hypothetical protein
VPSVQERVDIVLDSSLGDRGQLSHGEMLLLWFRSFLFQLARESSLAGYKMSLVLPGMSSRFDVCFLISAPYRPAANGNGQRLRTRPILCWGVRVSCKTLIAVIKL